ncbi:MAG: metallophosphoesterase [Mesorhizobium sp.]|jgi:calcineurin-like phosphoesterase family protein|nr:metallophosphoesterase [Mesorhizobium sp.]
MAYVTKRYIADLHFGHTSIIANCNRPFSSTEEMDAEIVRRWNETVKSVDDLTYILGDYGRPGQDIFAFKRLFHSLRGRKVLILGNHDLRNDGAVIPEIASLPWHLPPTHLLEVRDEGRRVILSHYSMRAWPASHHGAVHFYGHSHSRLPGYGLSRDVGVDMPDVDFTPRTFKELTAGMELDKHGEAA